MKKVLGITFILFLFIGMASLAHASYISEIEGNDSFNTAQSVDGAFSLDSDVEIFWSNTFKHASVNGTNGSKADVDYFKFIVGTAGLDGFFDIDHGWNSDLPSEDPTNLDTTMALFDSNRNVLAVSDDSTSDPGNNDDDYSLDSFIGIYTFAAPGTYYLAVSNYGNFPYDQTGNENWGTFVSDLKRPDGIIDVWDNSSYAGDSGPAYMSTNQGYYASGNYVLHVSLGHAVPEPATMLLFGSGLLGLAGFRRKFL